LLLLFTIVFARLHYCLLLFTMCLHIRVSFFLLFIMMLHGCVHFCCHLHVLFCISVFVFVAIYNDVAWLRSFSLLFTMLLHTIPALVLAAIYNNLCMNCSCNLKLFCILAVVVAAIYNAFARLRYFCCYFLCVCIPSLACCCYLQRFVHGCVHS
jgi:hypothetical protein